MSFETQTEHFIEEVTQYDSLDFVIALESFFVRWNNLRCCFDTGVVINLEKNRVDIELGAVEDNNRTEMLIGGRWH